MTQSLTSIFLTSDDFTGGPATYGAYHAKNTVKSPINLIEETLQLDTPDPDSDFPYPKCGWMHVSINGKRSKVFAQLTWTNPEDPPRYSGVFEYSLVL